MTSLCLLALLLAAALSASARENNEVEKQRTLFVEVETALKLGGRSAFTRHRETLSNYPLYPYLLYQDLHRRFARADEKEVLAFLSTYGGKTPIAEKLRHRWLAQLARRGRWDDFLTYYRESVNVENKDNRCRYAYALIHAGRVRQAQAWIRSLWLVDFSQPPSCDRAFQWGFEEGVIDDDLIWRRALMVWKRGRTGLVNYLGGKLRGDARHWFKFLKQARYHPQRTALQMRGQITSSPYAGDVMVFALRRLIAKDAVKAGELWTRVRRDCSACDARRGLEKEIGVAAARRLQPVEAYRWLSQLPPRYRDDESRYWRIRAALRAQNWRQVLASVDDLQSQDRAFSQWRYWRAYALAALGRRDEARAIWKELAQKDDYYGYLAADRLAQPYPHRMTALEFTEVGIAGFHARSEVARMRELWALGRPFDASRELLAALDRLTADEKLKLAFSADRWGWPIGAIRSISSSGAGGHLLQRFPMPYRSLVEKESRRYEVPMEWIYGIMRRESAFVERIRSPAGALGLMQLRPGTARVVARRLGLGRVSNHRILAPQINVRLGTAYIKRLHRNSDGNLAFALAGYNAGPTNVRRWLNTAPVSDVEVWVDTIPFDETRLYVRAVLFYALVYRHRLGKPQLRLRELMT